MAATVVRREMEPLSAVEADSTLSRLVRGVVAGEVSGAVFALVTVWFTTSVGMAGNTAFLMMSTIAKGGGQVDESSDVATGVLVHLGLSALFGVIFALLLPKMRTNGTLLLSAGVYGLVVYLVNFRIFSPVFFPAFQHANQPFEVLVHLVYGQLLAVFSLSRGVRRGEPIFDWR